MNALTLRNELVRVLAVDDRIMGVGQTGSLDAALIPGKSDIDLFVLCTAIPTVEERQAFYRGLGAEAIHMSVCNGGLWGYGDILLAGGIDVMPMYFTVQEMQAYCQQVLEGKHMEKDGRFYPVGRLASIATLHILYEKEQTWSGLQNHVNSKPIGFFKQWYAQEMGQVLDEEDLGRCEIRHEVLFFHQVLENALDHLLQALYAVNLCYFPSRKRTAAAIESFDHKPADCCDRLLRLVQYGSREDTMQDAMDELRCLSAEVAALGEQVFGNSRDAKEND